MRLVVRLVLASSLATVVVLAIYASISIASHRESLLRDMERGHRAMVSMLVEAVEAVGEERGEAEARALVAEVNRRRENVQLVWLPDVILVDGVDHQFVDGPEPFVMTRAIVRISGHVVGTVELIESFEEGERVIQGRVTRVVLTGMLMIVVAAAVGAGLGVLYVTRRVRALVSHARRVAVGDLDGRIVQTGARDELGDLAREMNAMTERLADARDRLQDETAARLHALEQLRHGERLMTVGKLAAGVAHELGTPLNVVTESAKMIARGETRGAAVTEYADIIAGQGDRMAEILRQILDFARPRPALRERSDLAELTRSSAALMQPLAEKLEQTIAVEASEPLMASVDPVRIQQVVANLLTNALQASTAGATVTIRVRATDARPPNAPPSEPPRHCAVIEVEDRGTGITAADLVHVFEPFFTTKDVGQGTGLGLSVAHGLVEEHGGWIEVDSEVGRGSVFVVHLPIGGERTAGGEKLPEASVAPSLGADTDVR